VPDRPAHGCRRKLGTAVSEFVDYLQEILGAGGALRARRMFGGYGLFRGELMIGLVVDDTLYLKADAHSAGCFRSRGLGQFEYVRRGRPVKLSYYRAPDEVTEDPDAAAVWTERAYQAAMRSVAKPGKRRDEP
jgi:DNA transformation protein